MEVKDKIVAITGGAAGIGATIAKMLADQGARVVRLDVAQPQDPSIGELFIECDVTSEESLAAAVARIRADMGEVSALFLNAGVMSRPASAYLFSDPFEIAGTDAYHRVFNVNVNGMVYGLKAFLPSLQAAGDAQIVATASTTGLTGLGPDPYYSMSKHAVVGFVRSFAQVLEPAGIKINAICPGGVKTEIVPQDMAELAEGFMEPEELAEAAIALLAQGVNGGIWVKDLAGKPMWMAEDILESA